MNGFTEWSKKHPGYFQIVLNEKFELNATDFSGILQKIKGSGADIFLSDAHLPDYITMHRQYVQSGMWHQMISYGARGPESDARKALGDAINYIFAGMSPEGWAAWLQEMARRLPWRSYHKSKRSPQKKAAKEKGPKKKGSRRRTHVATARILQKTQT